MIITRLLQIELFASACLIVASSTFAQSITITSPKAGDVLEAGKTYTLIWDTSLQSGTMTLILRKDSDANSKEILSAVPISAHQASWTVCTTIVSGNDYRLLAVTIGGSILANTPPFAIVSPQPVLAVTSPNGGEVWNAGLPQRVTWISQNIAPGEEVIVELYRYNQFEVWLGDAKAGTGYLDCITCAAAGNGYEVRLRVRDCCYRQYAADSSDAWFSLAGQGAKVEILHPVPGEVLRVDTPFSITWAGEGLEGFTTDVTLAVTWLAPWGMEGTYYGFGPVPSSVGQINVVLPFGAASSLPGWFYIVHRSPLPGCTIVQQVPVFVGYFTPPHVTAPAGGEALPVGSHHTIRWTANYVPGNLAIDLLNNGEPVRRLGYAAASAREFGWTVCGLTDDAEFTIRISNYPGGGAYQESSSPFTITGPRNQARLTSPNGGESIQAATTQTITWEPTFFTGRVAFALLKSGQKVADIGTAPASAGSFGWRVCPLLTSGDDYSIELTGQTCAGTISDISDGTFHIEGSAVEALPSLTLLSPLGGEVWAPGTTQTVTWSAENPIGDVYIAISRDSEILAEAFAPMAAGSAEIPLPSGIQRGSGCRASISWAGCDSVAHSESGYFQINQPLAAPPDFDGNGHVDSLDEDMLITCMTGPRVHISNSACTNADLDHDQDVDQNDYGLFQRCFNGSSKPPSSGCVE